jgi:hypothetical protein
MAISPTDSRILFTNYDITAYFVNLAFSSEHFISIKHRILATFNISKKKSILTACLPLRAWLFNDKFEEFIVTCCMFCNNHK